MELFLTHTSALEYWRIYGTEQYRQSRRVRRRTAPLEPPDASTLQKLASCGLNVPLNVTVGTENARRRSNLVHSRLLSGLLPEGCFVDVGRGMLVSSPEFCFLQMAKELEFPKLVELGYVLCGHYAMPVLENANQDSAVDKARSKECVQLTSVKKLSALLDRMEGFPAQEKAKSSLSYIADGSASPRETMVAMLLTLPYRYGGYGFPLPKMNAKIRPAKAAKQSSSKEFYYCDLFWEDYNLAVEYDSDAHHTGSEHIARDSMRRNSLISIDVTVLTVTRIQLNSVVEFEKVAKQLSIYMERRLQYKKPQFFKARRKLRDYLWIGVSSRE